MTTGPVGDAALAACGLPVIRGPRTASLDVHEHLRRLIIAGRLPAGSVVRQAQLARVFGVSRTPLREAFRMLQEEGLIEADLNHAARVRGLSAEELDTLYATRIALEALGARLTTGRLTSEEIETARSLLGEMDAARADGDMPRWLSAHRRFHQVCTSRASGPIGRSIASFGEQSERYLLTYQRWHPDSFGRAHREHVAILRAVCGTDPVLAGSLMAEHLAHTALNVVGDLEQGVPAVATMHALAMATGTPV